MVTALKSLSDNLNISVIMVLASTDCGYVFACFCFFGFFFLTQFEIFLTLSMTSYFLLKSGLFFNSVKRFWIFFEPFLKCLSLTVFSNLYGSHCSRDKGEAFCCYQVVEATHSLLDICWHLKGRVWWVEIEVLISHKSCLYWHWWILLPLSSPDSTRAQSTQEKKEYFITSGNMM
jgi:hypothetical protein